MGETRINSSANTPGKDDKNVIIGIAQSNLAKRSCLAAIVGAFTVFCFIYFRSQFEPSFDGKPLSYWLEEYNRAGAMEKMQPASKAIRQIGTNALMQLAENLEQIDPPWKRQLYGFINKNPIYKIPFRTSSSLHGPTLWALRALGTNAAPIIPYLTTADFIRM